MCHGQKLDYTMIIINYSLILGLLCSEKKMFIAIFIASAFGIPSWDGWWVTICDHHTSIAVYIPGKLPVHPMMFIFLHISMKNQFPLLLLQPSNLFEKSSARHLASKFPHLNIQAVELDEDWAGWTGRMKGWRSSDFNKFLAVHSRKKRGFSVSIHES